jgi:hypothetical protein
LLNENQEFKGTRWFWFYYIYLSTASTGSKLTSVKLGLLGLNLALDSLVLLREDNLNVAGRGHVGVDATVSTVGATALARSLVNLNVLDNKSLLFQALDLNNNNHHDS